MNKKDTSTIKELRTLTGLTDGQISSVFKALSYMVGIGNYYNGEEIQIPYFGKFKLKFDGDELDEQGNRIAKVNGFFILHDDVKRNVGIVEDFKKTQDANLLTELDSYKVLKGSIRQSLKNSVESSYDD